jgi:hypothetical protein
MTFPPLLVFSILFSPVGLGHGVVYNFMVEEILDYGPANLGKFGRFVNVLIAVLCFTYTRLSPVTIVLTLLSSSSLVVLINQS